MLEQTKRIVLVTKLIPSVIRLINVPTVTLPSLVIYTVCIERCFFSLRGSNLRRFFKTLSKSQRDILSVIVAVSKLAVIQLTHCLYYVHSFILKIDT